MKLIVHFLGFSALTFVSVVTGFPASLSIEERDLIISRHNDAIQLPDLRPNSRNARASYSCSFLRVQRLVSRQLEMPHIPYAYIL